MSLRECRRKHTRAIALREHADATAVIAEYRMPHLLVRNAFDAAVNFTSNGGPRLLFTSLSHPFRFAKSSSFRVTANVINVNEIYTRCISCRFIGAFSSSLYYSAL